MRRLRVILHVHMQVVHLEKDRTTTWIGGTPVEAVISEISTLLGQPVATEHSTCTQSRHRILVVR
jgi:hypothetical protein